MCRVLDLRPKGCRFEPHRRHCIVVLEQDTFILASPRKTRPCLTERLLMGRKESNQINKQTIIFMPHFLRLGILCLCACVCVGLGVCMHACLCVRKKC